MKNKSTIKAVCVLSMMLCELFSQKDSLLFFKKNTTLVDSLNTFGTEDKTTKQKDADNISPLSNDSGLIKKNTYRNIISVESSASFYRVPYRGFFTNQLTGEGELYNVSSNGVNVNYYRKFKRNSNWMWGMSLGYEWMWVRFYDVTTPYNPYDTTTNVLKYRDLALSFKELLFDNDGSLSFSKDLPMRDEMIKYFGLKTYYWEYFKVGYSLSYQKRINQRFFVNVGFHWTAYIAREISRLSNYNNSSNLLVSWNSGIPVERDGRVDFSGVESLIGVTPFYVGYYFYEKIKFYKSDYVPQGQMAFSLSWQYSFWRNNYLSFNLFFANLMNSYVPSHLNGYFLDRQYRYNHMSTPNVVLWPKGYFVIQIYPQIYQQLSISMEYGIRF